MEQSGRSFSHSSRLSTKNVLMICAAAIAIAILAGCGGGGSSSSPTPNPSKTTQVALQLSSTGNDQLTEFNIQLQDVTLTSKDGKTVTLLNGSPALTAEFQHLNGSSQPLLTVAVPQDTYVSAAATLGSSGFNCNTLDSSSGNLLNAYFAYGATNTSTISLPSPITISGTAMGLNLDLQLSSSYTLQSCYWNSPGFDPYTITPAFNLTPVTIAAKPTNPQNGKASGIIGQISSIDTASNSFAVQPSSGQTLTVSSASATVYQGISGFSALTTGTIVDADLAAQSDGSLLATRVAVEDPDTASLSIADGPVLYVFASAPVLYMLGREHLGSEELSSDPPFSFGSAAFQVSGQFANLQALPFAPVFSAASMVPGQNIYVSTHATSLASYPTYFPATTITLMPQTINGTIIQVSTSGNFSVYTVKLASYDLFPELATLGQTTLLTNSNTVVVYTDSNTQMLNSNALAAGSVMRFNGLVFNDNGTLRMDCGQLNDGVAE